mmetsp:Transcript_8573/g.7677  ORF Transcript_8573/g.7677 Transcript_8573/m.7677 type:complete len:372 (+) Transcript_8573:43-1158(+)|eukprot:CAMPEP_0196761018 /NCGR_PEP_ID=MMETSP1095-20130614/79_1 /TAXON_ID=96789 ORGANISM="Chromulina nebulosa, Strain UTEXLB2642" /NCGR_SAMPLE_ID=MMETSP1095 /ASSEMBLY_ACC=CAM_ASM_000446 /LENGTH=371 /DNA_ID=CAMNT_0042110013 /DNA_START=43 /DNA_END=1158 /DNA_ORIENTATION=+
MSGKKFVDKFKNVKLDKQEDDDEEENEEEEEVVEEEEDVEQIVLPPKVLKRVAELEKLHLSLGNIDIEYKKERAILEKKYHIQRVVIYDQRKLIVTGEVEPEAEESSESVPVDGEADTIKGIPEFWLRALANHPSISEIITEEDVPALESLSNITVDYADDYTSFTLNFHFNENEFFTNPILSKTYVVNPDVLDDKAPTLTSSTGTIINWKPSKDLTVIETKKKQKAKGGKNKGQVRTIVKTEPKNSFFHYFSDPIEPKDEEDEEEDEQKDDVKFDIEFDYDIGYIIRTDIIPDAVKWFTGEAVPEDEDGDYEEQDEDEEEEDEDEDDDEDEEEDKPLPSKHNKSKGKSTGFASAGGSNVAPGEQPECKQN